MTLTPRIQSVLLHVGRFVRLSVVAAGGQALLTSHLTTRQILASLAVGAVEVAYRQVVPVISIRQHLNWISAIFNAIAEANPKVAQVAIKEASAIEADAVTVDKSSWPRVNGQPVPPTK